MLSDWRSLLYTVVQLDYFGTKFDMFLWFQFNWIWLIFWDRDPLQNGCLPVLAYSMVVFGCFWVVHVYWWWCFRQLSDAFGTLAWCWLLSCFLRFNERTLAQLNMERLDPVYKTRASRLDRWRELMVQARADLQLSSSPAESLMPLVWRRSCLGSCDWMRWVLYRFVCFCRVHSDHSWHDVSGLEVWFFFTRLRRNQA